MNWLRLALANLLMSPLTSAVNVLLMSLGTASIVMLLLAGHQLNDTMSRNAKGIDLVVGAKGSPVQLILSSIYHADIPTGNIPLQEAQRWGDDPRVASAVPISLGDSYRGYRIVGTTPAYAEIYNAHITDGRWWGGAMEAVVGAQAASDGLLELGSFFVGAHGLTDAGHHHDQQRYQVVGVLGATGSVLDRLILTSLESVWELHRHGAQTASVSREQALEQARTHLQNRQKEDPEITAMLLSYQSPLAAISLPRQINSSSTLQAAAPALEVSRLLRLVGVGLDGLRAFAAVLIAVAALSVFAALYGSLRARRGDLAMLRCLGATRWELLQAIMLEGLLLSLLGILLGYLLGHLAMEFLGQWLSASRGVMLTGWTWVPAELWLLIGLIGVGVVSAIIPAVQAYRTDVASTLAQEV